MNTVGKLVVISGPSGVGKSVICTELLRLPCFRRIVTCTTRAPRKGEQEGKDYHFLSNQEFDANIAGGKFLEFATVHGQRYGTLRSPVDAAVAAGYYVLLAIDVQGARELRRAAASGNARKTGGWEASLVSIFLVPPDRKALRDRLRKRGTETREQLMDRLRTADDELSAQGEFDEVIVNDDLNKAVEDILRYLQVPESRCGEFADRVR